MKKKWKERIVYVVDDRYKLTKKYLNMSTEETDKLILEAREKEKREKVSVLKTSLITELQINDIQEEFLRELDKGIDDMENGRVVPHEEAMKNIEERLANR